MKIVHVPEGERLVSKSNEVWTLWLGNETIKHGLTGSFADRLQVRKWSGLSYLTYFFLLRTARKRCLRNIKHFTWRQKEASLFTQAKSLPLCSYLGVVQFEVSHQITKLTAVGEKVCIDDNATSRASSTMHHQENRTINVMFERMFQIQHIS